MRHKFIVMDVDGTLTNQEKKISPKTRNVLLQAQQQGVRLILASGRPTSGLMDFAHELQMENYQGLLVSYNGACVVDVKSTQVLYQKNMQVEEVKAVLTHLKKFQARALVDHGDYMYVEDVYQNMITYEGALFNVFEYEARGGKYHLCEVADLADFVDFPLPKLLTTADPEYLAEHYKAMMEPFKDQMNCVFTSPFYFEFTAQGIDKAKALHEVLTQQGYSAHDVIAFGDGQNDITMLEYADVGVCMKNGDEQLKLVANAITASNVEDGIAQYLETFEC